MSFLGGESPLDAEVLPDGLHKAGAQLLLPAMLRQDRRPLAATQDQMAALSRLERASLLAQVAAKLATVHSLLIDKSVVFIQKEYSQVLYGLAAGRDINN
jgi:hypothetical protein